jgi:hypothetical protein
MLRAVPELSGPVASDPVMSRLVTRLSADSPAALAAIRAARACRAGGRWVASVDIDATIVTSYSDKEHAAATWKQTWGLFDPLTVFADHGCDGSGEPLAIMLRPQRRVKRRRRPHPGGEAGAGAAAEAGAAEGADPCRLWRRHARVPELAG